MDYLAGFRLQQQRYLRYPRHVHVETAAVCNARCAFCPYSVMQRRGKRMSDELLGKIVQDLKEIPREVPFAISPFKVNEPLLDRKIFERIDFLAAELPNASFWFTSNFSLADESAIRRLARVPRLDYIWLSLNSLREDEYRQLMGLSLEKTVANVRRLLEVNRAKRFVPRIVLARVADNSPGDRQFVEDAQEVFAEFDVASEYEISLMRRGQWMGFTQSKMPDIPGLPCLRWFELSITCTGQVAFCCMDGLCEQPLGDLNQQSVLEVYNHPGYLELRSKCPPRRDVKPCRECSFL